MRLWYLSHRRPAKAQASLRLRTVSPEPSLFAHMKYGSRRRIRPNIRHLAPLDGWACAFEEWITEVEKHHNLMSWLVCCFFRILNLFIFQERILSKSIENSHLLCPMDCFLVFHYERQHDCYLNTTLDITNMPFWTYNNMLVKILLLFSFALC